MIGGQTGLQALSAAGVLCYAVGLLACAQQPLFSHDLYVGGNGSICDGGGFVATCWRIDPGSFQPSLPDLSSHDPALASEPVPGGVVFESGCRPVAIDVHGRHYARSDSGWLFAIAALRWFLLPGTLLLGLGALLAGRLAGRSRRTVAAFAGGLAVHAGVAMALLLFITAMLQRASSELFLRVELNVIFALLIVAAAGLISTIALTVSLHLRPATALEARFARGQTALALAVAIGSGAGAAWWISNFKFCF